MESIERFVIEDANLAKRIRFACAASQLAKDLEVLIAHFDSKSTTKVCHGCMKKVAEKLFAYSEILRLPRYHSSCRPSFLGLRCEDLSQISYYGSTLYYVDSEFGERVNLKKKSNNSQSCL